MINRRENENLREALSDLSNRASGDRQFLKRGFDIGQLVKLCKRAQRVLVFGTGHTALVPNLCDHFVNGLPDYLKMTFLLMDPIGDANKLAAFRANRPVNELSELYIRNLSLLAQLAKKTPDNRLQCRVIDYLPPYTIIAFDPHLPSGVMLIHLSAWRASTVDRPIVELTHDDDASWFEFFLEQFELMWKMQLPGTLRHTNSG